MAFYIFCGGGTAGHINPSLAIAKQLQKQEVGAQILYIGKENGLENEIVPQANLNFKGIKMEAIIGGGNKIVSIFNLIKKLKILWQGRQEVGKIMAEKRPQMVIATGGYASMPVLLAAKKHKIKILLHEQNAILGRANKYLLKMGGVSVLCVNFLNSLKPFLNKEELAKLIQNREIKLKRRFILSPGTWLKPREIKILLSGQPLSEGFIELSKRLREGQAEKIRAENLPIEKLPATRNNISLREKLKISEKARFISILGGSLGANSLNESIIAWVKACVNKELDFKNLKEGQALSQNKQIHILLSAGTRLFSRVREQASLAFSEDKIIKKGEHELIYQLMAGDFKITLEIRAYLENIHEYVAASDWVLSRAGAGMIFELMALGKPALFVPFPHAVYDHQRLNAEELVTKKASFMVNDADFKKEFFHEFFLSIENEPELLMKMGAKMLASSSLEASTKIVCEILQIGGEGFEKN